MNHRISAKLPAALQWHLGSYRITVINDSSFVAGEGYFTEVPEGGMTSILKEHYRPEEPTLTTNVFLIEGATHPPILIDTGMGDKYGPEMRGHLLETLTSIGVNPDQIGMILLTHLHGDHYFGLRSAAGAKNFINAKLWVSSQEEAYWLQNPELGVQDQESARDIQEALQLYERLTPYSETELVPGISPVALPGHTPGQFGFLLRTEEESLLFCADLLSLPAVQARIPTIGFATDVAHSLAVQTRKTWLTKAADEGFLLAGAHFEFPCLSYVKKAGETFELIPKQWFV